MKFKLHIFIITGISMFSCGDLVDGLNNNPNSPVTAPYQNILTGAEIGNIILQTGETARRASIFCGYYTGIANQHQAFSSYTVTTSDFDELWNDAFVNTLRNAKVAQAAADEEGITGITIGITQVIQALAFGTTTSLFGDIPFDEAGIFEIENPRFESQSEVYNKIQTLLDEAIINLQSGEGRPASGADIYFNGDPEAWAEVAYTLKARYFMHAKDYAAAYSAASNGIQSSANSMMASHGDATDDSNLSYQFFVKTLRGVDVIVSDFMASLIVSNEAQSPDFSSYRGNAKTNETGRYHFYTEQTRTGWQPNTTDGFAAQTASAPIVTYQENLLILAEAGFRSNGFVTGLDHLNEFRAFMDEGGYLTSAESSDIQYDAYEPADFNNGGMENPDGISTDDALLREILEERYVTLFGQIEGFNELRRTMNETTVRVPVQPSSGDEFPQRFIYPQSEIDRNSNTPDPIPDLFEATGINQ